VADGSSQGLPSDTLGRHDSVAWIFRNHHHALNPHDQTSQTDPRSLPRLKRRFRGMGWRSRP
jgi:hypothetical protein